MHNFLNTLYDCYLKVCYNWNTSAHLRLFIYQFPFRLLIVREDLKTGTAGHKEYHQNKWQHCY